MRARESWAKHSGLKNSKRASLNCNYHVSVLYIDVSVSFDIIYKNKQINNNTPKPFLLGVFQINLVVCSYRQGPQIKDRDKKTLSLQHRKRHLLLTVQFGKKSKKKRKK